MPAGAEMEVARANRAVPPRVILDLSSICYTDRLGAGFGHGGANPNAKEKVLLSGFWPLQNLGSREAMALQWLLQAPRAFLYLSFQTAGGGGFAP